MCFCLIAIDFDVIQRHEWHDHVQIVEKRWLVQSHFKLNNILGSTVLVNDIPELKYIHRFLQKDLVENHLVHWCSVV